MEDSVKKIYVSAIDTLLERSEKISSQTYEFVYNIVYGKKYKGVDGYAAFLSQKIDDKGLLSSDDNGLDINEKETIATYWLICRFTNYTEKKERTYTNDNGEEEKISFADLYNEYFDRYSDIFSRKKLKDKKGRIYDGSEFFSSKEDDLEKEELNEGFIVACLISLAVYGAAHYASPYIAKVAPKACSFVRDMAENHPVITEIARWTVPGDIDAFIEQDMINKGEISEEEEIDPNDEIVDDTEGYDEENFEAVTQDDLYGYGYDEDGNGVGSEEIDYELPAGYEYVKTDTYEYGHDYDEEGNYIGGNKNGE